MKASVDVEVEVTTKKNRRTRDCNVVEVVGAMLPAKAAPPK
jgi:hypothetical protein